MTSSLYETSPHEGNLAEEPDEADEPEDSAEPEDTAEPEDSAASRPLSPYLAGLHEALVRLMRHRPAMVAELLADRLGTHVPPYQEVRLYHDYFTEPEYRTDLVVVLADANNDLLMAVTIDAQMRRDPEKIWTWPAAVASVYQQLDCPSVLTVLCVDAEVASWAATPISIGLPGSFDLNPVVLGPDQFPVVTDADQTGHTRERVVLSVLAHTTHPDLHAMLDTLLRMLWTVDRERATLYADVVWMGLPDEARHYLEEIMTTRTDEYQSDFVRRFVFQGRAEGEVTGAAKALLTVLDARGIVVSDEARNRITRCTDAERLDTWIRRAVTATLIHDVFGKSY